MTAQNKFYITLICMIVGVAVWLYFYYLPTLQVINDSKTKLLTYNTKISSASKASNNLEEIESSLNRLKSELANLEKKIVDKSQLESFAKLMYSEAQKYKLTIINVSPIVNYYFKLVDQESDENYVTRLPFEMNLTGDFLSFTKFLDNLENLPFYIHLEGMNIEISKEDPDKLEIHLLSSVFVKTGN